MTSTTDDVILLDDTLTETFLTDLQSRGRTEETLKCYRNSIGKLRGFLPGHRLSHDAMLQWPDAAARAGLLPEHGQQRGFGSEQPAGVLRKARLAGHALAPARNRAARAFRAANICGCSRPRASSKRNAPTCS